MSLIPTIYSSTDAGAPQLSGTVGSLVSVLRAILVAGYGTAPNAKAGLGWTEVYTGTDKAAFRNSPVTGTGMIVRVDDSAAIGNAKWTGLRAYESMTGIDVGANPSPTVAAEANGVLWQKSSAASGASRPWWAIGNERSLYFFIDHAAGGIASATPRFIGDFPSLLPGDAHNFMISSASFGGINEGDCGRLFYAPTTAISGTASGSSRCGYVMRNFTKAVGGAELFHVASPLGASGEYAFGGFGAAYPHAVTGGLLWTPSVLRDSAAFALRGQMPGLIYPGHNLPFADLEVVPGSIGLPGVRNHLAKRFRAWNYGSVYTGCVLFDTTAEW